MRKKSLIVLFTAVLVSWATISCQDEYVVERTEALDNNSQLTGMLTSMSANNTTLDNIIDSTSCFSVQLPVGVLVNGQQVTVQGDAGYEAVEAIINQSSSDEDFVSLVFPVTVVYPDYEEVKVESQTEFNTLVGVCDGDPGYIDSDCVSLNFPITVFKYNSGYQIQDTQVINNNEALYAMLQNLGPDEYYSLGYPVTLNVSGGATVTVSNNNELLNAITNALADCDGGGCTNPGVLVEDLLIYMPFSGGVVQDLKGNLVSAPTDIAFTTDRDGNQDCAIVFNGTQFLHMPVNNNNGLVQGNAFSISLWFRMQNTNGADLENLFTKGDVSGEGFELSVYDLNTPMFMAGSLNIWDMEWNSDASLPVDTENWHHLVATVDANNSVKLYRDGQLKNSISLSNANIANESLDYYIGNNFKGFMDDLRVYKKALTLEEVQILYQLEGDCNTCLE
jgi:hypothetical protein